jgi:uracil-DNA glycosylase family 4
MPSRIIRYRTLVAERRQCRACPDLVNPACVSNGEFDSEDIGPWTSWNGDLNARLVVVGQEWGDVESFERQRGVEMPGSATNRMLRELLAFVGIDVEPAPERRQDSGVYLTNAALCLKTMGGVQGPVQAVWFSNCGKRFLRSQVELVGPKVVVTLGMRAYDAMRHAFSLPRVAFRTAVNQRQPISLANGSLLVPAYHCGQRILNTHRPRDAQFEDWRLVKELLMAQHA